MGGSIDAPLEVFDEGGSQGKVRKMNFVGASVSVTVSDNVATVTISGGGGGTTINNSFQTIAPVLEGQDGEESFLGMIPGPPGSRGPSGPQGPQGLDGLDSDEAFVWYPGPTTQVISNPLLEASLDPTSTVIETEKFVIHRDHLKLSSSNRMTVEGTARIYLRDIGEASWGAQGELAGAGNIILGVPKSPRMSFTIPTDYQHQILNRLIMTGTMRGTLQGNADLYVENDAPQGGRISLSGRGALANG